MVKGANPLQPLFDLLDGQRVVLDLQRLRPAGARQDHQELGPELLERPRQFLALGVLADKVEYRQVALGVPDHAGVIFQLQQADVPVMVLQGFELEPGAVFRSSLKPSSLPSCAATCLWSRAR